MMLTNTEKKILKRLGHMTEIDPRTRIEWRRLMSFKKFGETLIADVVRLIAPLREPSNQEPSNVIRANNVEMKNLLHITMITINRFRFVGSVSHAMSDGIN